jgi:hypothetical protein
MKQLLAAIVAVTLISFTSTTGDELKDIPVNAQLAYNVDFRGQKYQFLVEVKKKAPELIFSYNLTMGGGMTGTIMMNENALTNAVNQQNYFNGTDRNLDTETTVWVSKKVYDEIKNSGKTSMGNSQGMGAFKAEEYTLEGTEDFPTTLNGEAVTLKALHVKAANGYQYWIWDNAKDPLILKMDLGWGISLKEVTTEN